MHNTVPETLTFRDDFNFEFYGQSYDGSVADNRIQVSGSGFLFFVDDGTTTARVVESTSAGCWPTDGTFRSNFWTTCGGSGNILQGPLSMMAPFWSRETFDYCGASASSTTPCEGIWMRTLPFDGQGRTISADIS